MVGGRYRVDQHIGRGGMQEVFRAHDVLLDWDVALKTPQAGQSDKRFQQSALIAAMVNHHNVAKTLDYFVEDGADILIEELVVGETLQDKLNSYGYLDPHLGARVFHHLAKGIAASHRVGVIHRDLKPSNVMVSRGSNLHALKITDFGIATLTEEVFDEAAKAGDITKSTSGTIRGALPFMAPEMMFRKKGENPGPAMDIWSLGAMMFKLLTGVFPFGEYLEAAVNVKMGNREQWPTFMTSNYQFAPLARELQRLVETCLNYDPNQRPSAADLCNECQNLCCILLDRSEGTVDNLIQNNRNGFIQGPDTAFFCMNSVYGDKRPSIGSRVCYCSFPGTPRDRAHPVIVLKK
jgi:serine/threonine-protein kinase